MRRVRTFAGTALVAVVTAAGMLTGAGAASAATGDVGFSDQSYNGSPYAPTSDKPQSKLWFAQGSWWANMFDTVSRTWHIFRLDRPAEKWVDTGVRIDDRANTLADVLWDGTHLYVASHVVTISSDGGAQASVAGSPARLYRFSYDTGRATYVLDTGFPAVITSNSSESMTIDKDSTGTLWATWTQVSKTSTGFTSSVYVNSTNGSDSAWGTPLVVPVTGSAVAPDDISTVVAFGRSKIGVLWSNQLDGGVYWAVHNDGAPKTSWHGAPAVRGSKQSDDHLNIKAVQADTSGRVFAVVKTSLDGSPTAVSTDPQIRLLDFKPGTGSWSVTTVGTLADCHTRPQLILDEEQQTVHVFATAPTSGGCPYPGAPGTIYDKTAPMGNPVFAAGRGTPVIRDAASANMNDVTTTKQSVTATSGIVVLASNQATKRYWHADLSAGGGGGGGPVAPTAAFTASPQTGTAPLPVQFTDTSTGSPTSWSWTFGDGSTATTQNPTHTYAAAGTYSVSLTATNAAGTGAPATATVTVGPAAPPPTGPITAGASSTAGSTTAVAGVTIPRPAGVATGNVLIAQIAADKAPAVSAAPSGWTPAITPLTIAGNARLFAYVHVVTDPATEPASYTWQLSAAVKWNAGITAFSGVDTANPFDTPASTATNTTYTSRSLTVPGVTTTTSGALVIGGVGLDSKATAVTAPSGWAESWESTGAQVSELAHGPAVDAGPTGTVSWSLSAAAASGGWIRALRPA